MDHLLICDRDADFTQVLYDYLTIYGYSVEVVTSSTQIIESCKKQKPALSIWPILLEPAGGFVVAKTMKKLFQEECKLLLYGLESPSVDEFITFYKEGIVYISKYAALSRWRNKIEMLINREET